MMDATQNKRRTLGYHYEIKHLSEEDKSMIHNLLYATGIQSVKYDRIMRWWGSNLGQGLLHP